MKSVKGKGMMETWFVVKKTREKYEDEMNALNLDQKPTTPPRSLAALVYSILQSRRRINTHPLDASSMREYHYHLNYICQTFCFFIILSSHSFNSPVQSLIVTIKHLKYIAYLIIPTYDIRSTIGNFIFLRCSRNSIIIMFL